MCSQEEPRRKPSQQSKSREGRGEKLHSLRICSLCGANLCTILARGMNGWVEISRYVFWGESRRLQDDIYSNFMQEGTKCFFFLGRISTARRYSRERKEFQPTFTLDWGSGCYINKCKLEERKQEIGGDRKLLSEKSIL